MKSILSWISGLFNPKPAPSMVLSDMEKIEFYAMGKDYFYGPAVRAYRRNIPILGRHGNIHQQFMTADVVMTASRCIGDQMERARLRKLVLGARKQRQLLA